MLFGKKDVVLHAYTCRAEVYERSKIFKSATDKPSWWKNLPIFGDGKRQNNMKSCAGINDLYAKGFTMPLWSDVVLEYAKRGENWWSYEFADEESKVEVHSDTMREGWAMEYDYQHFKLSSPWLIKCDEPIDFLMTNAAYENEKPLDWFVPNGVVNFKYQSSTQVNVLIKRGVENGELFLPFGLPMMQLIPLTERKVTIEHHLVDKNQWDVLRRTLAKRVTFQRDYYKRKRCPFSGVSNG